LSAVCLVNEFWEMAIQSGSTIDIDSSLRGKF